ncbi:MAG: hypothetical protein HW387_975 [Parachlamydiales bacterium]|nr:hypothetical protein [Parachlamydiales bacterium]
MKTKTIGIVASELPEYLDPDSIYSGMGGAEEAVIYVSKELAARGYRVIVYGNPKPDSIHSLSIANPRFLDISRFKEEKLDIGIAKCLPRLGPELRKIASKVYLWTHGYNMNLAQEHIDSYDGVLWLSQWQRDCFVRSNPSFERFKTIFGNGIDPAQFPPITERKNPYSCIYATSYARGLEVLLNQWPEIKNKFPRATLDVYYGWSGVSSDIQKELIEKLSALQELDVFEHGQVGHEELNQAYSRASFWVFPSSREPETFCISALRAQYAGAVPIVHCWGALNETARYGCRCFRLERFSVAIVKALENAENITLEERKQMRGFINEQFTWKVVVDRWLEHFVST